MAWVITSGICMLFWGIYMLLRIYITHLRERTVNSALLFSVIILTSIAFTIGFAFNLALVVK